MPRFVVLWHETPPGAPRASHFDLLLERAGTLRTWALERWPDAGQTAWADSLPDHRLAYLSYEGPISGERGAVRRVEQGDYELLADKEEEIQLALAGARWRGTLTLTRPTGGAHRWRVVWSPAGAAD